MSLFMENTQMKWTKSDLLIMEFIENHTDDFLFMSIGQLAQHLQVSEATISRFARHMGYHDFKEMKSDIVGKSLAEALRERLREHCSKTRLLMLPNGFHFSRNVRQRHWII